MIPHLLDIFLMPWRFQAMWNMATRCTLIIGYATDKIFNQCTK